MAITYRLAKGSALTSTEIDTNFSTLETNPVFKGANVTLPSQSVALTGSVLPVIRPSLNLDFANSKQLDPRITFTRGSSATYYDGKTTAKAEQNLLLQSNGFATANWSVTNASAPATGITAPDGTLTAYSFTATAANATLYQTLTTSALAYTLTLYIQRVTGTGAVSLTLDGTTLTPQTITASWARYSLPNVTPTAASHTIGLQLAVSGDVVNIWGAQLEQRSQATAYTPTTTSAITNYIPQLMTAPLNVARIDHEPLTGKCLGLLIEESRINFIPYSQNFTDASWAINAASLVVEPNYSAPNGTSSAVKLIPTVNLVTHNVLTNTTKKDAGVYTASLYVKSAGYKFITIGLIFDSNSYRYVVEFNTDTGLYSATSGVQTGAIAVSAGSYSTVATPVGNGWFRVSITATCGAGMTQGVKLRIWNPSPIAVTGIESGQFSGDGTSGVLVWGAQVEAGAFATSYIVNNGTPAGETRFADQASMTGTNFSSWYNSDQGSAVIEYVKNGMSSGTAPLDFGSNNNGKMIRDSSTSIGFNQRGTRSLDTPLTTSTTYAIAGAVDAQVKVGMVMSNSPTMQQMGAVNGVVTNVGAYSNAEIGIPISYITFNALSGCYAIKKLTYYPKALTSTELQGLTQL